MLISDNRKWFALSVRPRHEKSVGRILEGKGYQLFLPLYEQPRRYACRVKKFELPLFPGYLFCRFDPLHRLPILTTPGVMQIMGYGRIPAPVDDEEILSLQLAVRARVPLKPHPYLTVGQRVYVDSGVLEGVEGVLVRIKESFRLVISVSLLQSSVLLEVDADSVSAATLSGCREDRLRAPSLVAAGVGV